MDPHSPARAGVRMTGRHRVALVLLAIVLVCAAVWAIVQKRATEAASNEAERRAVTGEVPWATPAPVSRPRGSEAAAAAAQRDSDVRAAPPPQARAVRGPMTANREAFERARNLGTLFNTLILSTDPDALFFAERALRECQPYIMAAAQTTTPPPLDRYRPAPPDDPMTARRQEAYTALQARCSGFDLGSDPAATRKALRDALLAANDPRAALEQMTAGLRRGTAPEAAMEKARELASTGDPYVLEQASALMASMRSRYVFMLDGQLVRPDIVAAGWMMAACDAGRSCGAEWVQAPCAFITECDARDLESSMQRYQLTPQDYDRMQLVRNRINQGVASGQWDAALFMPQSPPPGYRRWGP